MTLWIGNSAVLKSKSMAFKRILKIKFIPSMKTFVEGILVAGTLNVINFAASVVNYSRIESTCSSNGDLLNTKRGWM